MPGLGLHRWQSPMERRELFPTRYQIDLSDKAQSLKSQVTSDETRALASGKSIELPVICTGDPLLLHTPYWGGGNVSSKSHRYVDEGIFILIEQQGEQQGIYNLGQIYKSRSHPVAWKGRQPECACSSSCAPNRLPKGKSA
eukprot:1195771-Prorocentrum_minimum.AAC.3